MASVPQGIHNAVCIGVIFVGSHRNAITSHQRVVLLWEVHLPNKTATMSREYTFSYFEESNLLKHLESWRGGPFTKSDLCKFTLRNVLGIPCRLEIQKVKSTGAKYVENVHRFPKHEEKPVSDAEYIYFDINDKNTYSDYEKVPHYIIARIKQSPEYKKSGLD